MPHALDCGLVLNTYDRKTSHETAPEQRQIAILKIPALFPRFILAESRSRMEEGKDDPVQVLVQLSRT